ncbi:MAG: hypothetical protein EP335_04315 [Alphaproteobacteria bacterium]|nr:MAG: hypothetical protein EP335_04315 [Alphaproteobacteria bacterium]
MKKEVRSLAFYLAGLAGLVTGIQASAYAETTVLDVQVGAKAAAFVQPALEGDILTAIVFDPANPASKADADNIFAALGNGLKIKSGTLKPKLVPVGELDKLSDVRVVFLAHGVGGGMSAVAGAAASRGILTISNDMNCVNTDQCSVGVESKPKVSIVVSKSATAAAGLQFGAAFLMMVKER